MRHTVSTRSRSGWAMAGVAMIAALVASCTPPASPPAPPGPPVISRFVASSQRSEAPVLATLGWTITDPNNDLLTCRVDTDGDGGFDQEVVPCRSIDTLLAEIPSAGSRTFTLEVSDGMSAPVTAQTTLSATPGPSETYEITLRLDPTMRPEFRQAFEDAAARWSEVIIAGVSDQRLDIPAGFLGWIPGYAGTVDDVLIDARDTPLDGPGKVLGRAGGLTIREPNWQPYWGLMEFDTADLEMLQASGRLRDVVLHEMGHVLGLGANWLLTGVVDNPLVDPTYTGKAGVAAYQELGGRRYVPLENEGGVGTVVGHWRETTFGNELMTGYLNSGSQALSRLTVGALADQGYGVALSAADPYTLPGPAAARARSTGDDGTAVDLHTESVEPILIGNRPA